MLLGAVSSSDDFLALADLFMEYNAPDPSGAVVAAAYAMVYAIRLIEQPRLKTVVAYALTDKTLSGQQVYAGVREMVDLVQSKKLVVRLCCCDGASPNISAIKSLCQLGRGDISCEQPTAADGDSHYFEPNLENPLHQGQWVWFVVCSDHCLKVSVYVQTV